MIEVLGQLGVAGWTMLAIILGSPVAAAIISKRVKPATTPLEMIQELQDERNEDRSRLASLEKREKIRDDYIHQLRQHIADGNPPPPPPWPKELTS